MKFFFNSKRYILPADLYIKAFAFFLFLIFNFHFSILYAQFQSASITKIDSVGYIEVSGNVIKNRKPLEDASITVYEGNKKISNIRTPSNGKFNFKLEYNKVFNVEITKKGLVTKKFDFDTYFPSGIDNSIINPFNFTIVLFPKYANIDMSILEKPLAIIKFQKKYNDFFYDYNYSK